MPFVELISILVYNVFILYLSANYLRLATIQEVHQKQSKVLLLPLLSVFCIRKLFHNNKIKPVTCSVGSAAVTQPYSSR